MNLAKARRQLDALMKKLVCERLDTQVLDESSVSSDIGEVASANGDKAVAAVLADKRTFRLVLAQAARRRIDDGSYGVCLGCGKPISEKRLATVPEAAFCCPCQERRERGRPQPRERRK